MFPNEISLPDTSVLALRGPLTASLIGLNGDIPFGDPGLFVSDMIAAPKGGGVGIVPHHFDRNFLFFEAVRGDERFNIIDVEDDWRTVAKQISESKVLISSSLHGLIAADAFRVPRQWIELSPLVAGNGFKFKDYAASICQRDAKPVVVKTVSDLEMAVAQAADHGPAISVESLRTIKDDLRTALKPLMAERDS